MRSLSTLGISAAALALLAGCVVGPNYSPPAAPKVGVYQRAPLASLRPGRGEPAQRLVSGKAIPAAWWSLFRSTPLNRLVREALSGSPTIQAARARLAAARQSVVVARGAFYPQLDAAAFAERGSGNSECR